MRRQIVNQRQQPSERHYERDRETYYRDEERDFSNGADYLPQRRHYAGERGGDYRSPNNTWQQRHQDYREYSDRLYTPSFDYGYSRDEYYPMDPAHESYRNGPASGYGNDNSVQGRDFENWLHGGGDFRREYYSGRPADDMDYGHGNAPHHREQDHDRRRGIFSWFRKRPRHQHYDPYHDRTDRHQEIVVPFKDEEYYGQNDYNHSEGFGNSQMVYHEEQRRRGRRGW